jgi:hypothetical protein
MKVAAAPALERDSQQGLAARSHQPKETQQLCLSLISFQGRQEGSIAGPRADGGFGPRPKPDRLVMTAGGDGLTIWGKGDAGDRARVSAQSPHISA